MVMMVEKRKKYTTTAAHFLVIHERSFCNEAERAMHREEKGNYSASFFFVHGPEWRNSVAVAFTLTDGQIAHWMSLAPSLDFCNACSWCSCSCCCPIYPLHSMTIALLLANILTYQWSSHPITFSVAAICNGLFAVFDR